MALKTFHVPDKAMMTFIAQVARVAKLMTMIQTAKDPGLMAKDAKVLKTPMTQERRQEWAAAAEKVPQVTAGLMILQDAKDPGKVLTVIPMGAKVLEVDLKMVWILMRMIPIEGEAPEWVQETVLMTLTKMTKVRSYLKTIWRI